MTAPEPEFERLVLEHLDGLYNLARWLTRNMDEAQDLVQETALKALKARDQFRGGTTLTAWLYRILRNSFIDRYWKRQREPSGQEGDLPGVLGDLEQALEETEIEHLRPLVAADINRALKALPEQWRTTILLAEVEGLTWEEVAEIMGCPLGTVQSRIFRARRVLRQLLKDYAPEDKGEE